jgi:hypothetical protein
MWDVGNLFFPQCSEHWANHSSFVALIAYNRAYEQEKIPSFQNSLLLVENYTECTTASQYQQTRPKKDIRVQANHHMTHWRCIVQETRGFVLQ